MTLVALVLTGCPPTGEPPPFDPQLPDVGPSDAATDGGPTDGRVPPPDTGPDPDDGVPPADAAPDLAPDVGPPPGCVDRDDDGFVEMAGCALPPGDCAPDDPERGPGADERCNGIDDDCDGAADEGEPEVGLPCETGAPGLCSAGVTDCQDGEPQCIAQNRPAPAERCDGVDDDCDGQVDEGDPDSGAPCAIEGAVGACAQGVEACRNGMLRCIPTTPPGPEVCNGVDDDCDGDVDEGDPGAGVACDTGLDGICAVGVTICGGGEGIGCQAEAEPGDETCNGVDDDCDGETDELFGALGEPCRVGEGICRRDSVLVCNAAGDGVECDATAGDGRNERCNEADDDCDGRIDEGFGVFEPCTVGLGECTARGIVLCADDGRTARCAAEAGEPRDELCDGLDDDCDGAVDEAFPVDLPCVDDAGLCAAPGVFVCAEDGATAVCDAPPVMPAPERCNGRDDDCDESADEGFEGLGEPCAVGVGACRREGVQACDPRGQVSCGVSAGAPRPELCNGIDDDCDGRIDDEAPCLGPPTAVVTLRFARADDPACADFTGDGVADNAFAVLAGRFAGELAEAFAAERRVMLWRMPDLDGAGPTRVELVDARPALGGPRPLLRSVTAEGRGRQVVDGVVAAADGPAFDLETPAPAGVVQLPSPLFYDRDPRFADLVGLRLDTPGVTGGPVLPVDDAGLRVDEVRLTGTVDRQLALEMYAAAADRCAAAGAAAPPGCAIFAAVDRERLDGLLVPDVDLDPTPGADALSACFIVTGLALDDAASVPAGGGPCAARSDCFRNLACRPAPAVADPEAGAALADRCAVPGAGLEPFGVACASDDDCLEALCLRATGVGGRCTDTCAVDADCPLNQVCRGVPRAVDGARSTGGASARVCTPTAGSGAACGSDGDCPGVEVCGLWLDDAGVAGVDAQVAGRCQIADPGAAPGSPCVDHTDCDRAHACVPDLDGALRCAAPCDGAGQCDAGDICTDRVFAPAVGDSPEITHGYCLPVPEGAGSGDPCAADVDCPVGETCAGRLLEAGGVVERYCAAGVGWGSVGQPCAGGADCASGVCAGGFCAGACTDDDDCGANLGCIADGFVVDGLPAGGLCGPATLPCADDAACAADPACGGGRCVCAGDTCLVGCQAPDGACPRAGDLCVGAAGQCAPFCRDDADEPDDRRATATPIPVSPRDPITTVRRQLCLLSPVDWLRIPAAQRPVRVRLEYIAPRAEVTVDLFDAAGELLAEGVRLEPLQAELAELAEAPDGEVFVRVRAAGLEDGLDYQLRVELLGEPCVDPSEPEPADWPAAGIELGGAPGERAVDSADGVICPGDVDWFPVWLDGGDELTVELEVFEAIGAGVQLEVWGPDAPGTAGSSRRASLPGGGGGRAVVFAGRMACGGGGTCVYDGQPTAIPCANGLDCRGAPFYVRTQSASLTDGGEYRVITTVQRALDRECIPDPQEPDDDALDETRLLGALPAGAAVDGAEGPTFAPDRDVALSGRVCAEAQDGNGPDLDVLPVQARAGERIAVDIGRPAPVPGPLDVRFLRWQDDDWQLVGQVPVDLGGRVGQDIDEDGRYAVAIAAGEPGFDAPYDLVLRRETTASDDRGCDAAVQVLLEDGVPTVIDGTTSGQADSFTPKRCIGGGGPDRVYAVSLPRGVRALQAEVEALGDGDPAVSVRADCAAVDSELGCNEDDATAEEPRRRARVAVPVDGPRVFVVVDSYDGAGAGDYRLTLIAE